MRNYCFLLCLNLSYCTRRTCTFLIKHRQPPSPPDTGGPGGNLIAGGEGRNVIFLIGRSCSGTRNSIYCPFLPNEELPSSSSSTYYSSLSLVSGNQGGDCRVASLVAVTRSSRRNTFRVHKFPLIGRSCVVSSGVIKI